MSRDYIIELYDSVELHDLTELSVWINGDLEQDCIDELYLTVELYDSVELCHKVRIPAFPSSTKCLIKKDGVEIIGQMEASIGFSGSLIEISNLSCSQWVKYLNNQLAGRKLQVSGTIIYNNSAVYQQVRSDAISGKKSNYSIEFLGEEAFSAFFIPTNLSDSATSGNKVTTSIALQSSGTVASIS